MAAGKQSNSNGHTVILLLLVICAVFVGLVEHTTRRELTVIMPRMTTSMGRGRGKTAKTTATMPTMRKGMSRRTTIDDTATNDEDDKDGDGEEERDEGEKERAWRGRGVEGRRGRGGKGGGRVGLGGCMKRRRRWSVLKEDEEGDGSPYVRGCDGDDDVT